MDATGLPVHIGDRVVFVEDYFHRKSLRKGKVIEFKNVKVLVEFGSGVNRKKTLKSLKNDYSIII